jgi:chemotaxis protein CheC
MVKRATAWYEVGSVSRVEIMVSAALLNAARGLADFLERPITTGTVQARMVTFDKLFHEVGHPESETVAVYLKMQGELGGQAMLIMSTESALNLAALLMERAPGSSKELGELERSALAEVGHLMVAYFLNAMAVLTGRPQFPSPPAVMVDMLGSVMNILAASVGETSDALMIIETVLQDTEGMVTLRLWVLPDLAAQFK